MKKYFLILFFLIFAGAVFPQQDNKIIFGKATFYASKFQGRRTYSGAIFDHKKYTAAHATLPMHTWIKVTNLQNNKTLILEINDRCPKHKNLILDLTRRAAEDLDFYKYGVTNIKMEILDSIPVKGFPTLELIGGNKESISDSIIYSKPRSSLKKGYWIQLATYSEYKSALSLASALEKDFPGKMHLRTRKQKNIHYIVFLGPFSTKKDADIKKNFLKSRFRNCSVVKIG
ncbi:MAG: septal ring lytic transglycosylase RlpA family protein [Bacteroidota bacterium]